MKYLHLVFANLKRRKGRNILTILSVALALFLFASLQTVVTTIQATAQFGNVRRLVSTNATGITFVLPISYANRLRAVPGVENVSWANWFGGAYGDGKRFFAQFAIIRSRTSRCIRKSCCRKTRSRRSCARRIRRSWARAWSSCSAGGWART